MKKILKKPKKINTGFTPLFSLFSKKNGIELGANEPNQGRHMSSIKRAGFTLIEIMMVVASFSMVAIGVMALVANLFTMYRQQGGLLSDADQARKLAFSVINELRSSQTSATGSYCLQEASAQQLIFYSDVNRDNQMERIRYYIQNGKLYKGVISPSGNPVGYNVNNESSTMVQDHLANGANPVFYYYDGSYTGVSDNYLAQPVNVTQVKFAKVKLIITNVGGAKNTATYTVTASGAVRNLKTNLGQ